MSAEGSNVWVDVCENYESLCKEAVRKILSLSVESIERKGRFDLVLSGGDTPKGIYQLMASRGFRDDFKWEQMHFFWGDERWVSPRDPKSNYRMAAEILLTQVDLPIENIHPIKTQGSTPEEAAALYEKQLVRHFGLQKGEFPKFDLILLGLGDDGHVASLFPGSPSLAEASRLVVATEKTQNHESRITLTLPVINSAFSIFFLVSGRSKSQVLRSVIHDPENNFMPARHVYPDHGGLFWFVDKEAASLLLKK